MGNFHLLHMKKSNYLVSLEGWNFDKLSAKVFRWNKIGYSNFKISEGFKYGNLFIQLFESDGRIVGMLDRKPGDIPLVITLGTWSRTTTSRLKKFAERNNYLLVSGNLLTEKAINILQSGLQ